MARIEILRELGRTLSRKLEGLSRTRQYYVGLQESKTEEGPADKLIRKKVTGRFRGIT